MKVVENIKSGINRFFAYFEEEKPKRNYIDDSDIGLIREAAYFLSAMAQANIEKGKPIDGKIVKGLSEQIKIALSGLTV